MSNNDKYFDILKTLTPNGSQTLSKMPNKFVNGVYPKVLEWGKGGIVYDVEGRSFIDLVSGLGAISVGYANERINNKVVEQLLKGTIFSLPNMLEAFASAELNRVVGFTDQWKFLKTGTEATTAAVKAARAYTGRNKVMVCGYHGWNDWYSIINDRKAGIPIFNKDLVTKAEYNSLSSFHKLLNGDYACVIMEPTVFDMPEQGFLQTIREWCNITKTVFIMDEVVTGGRYSGFVASNYFKVEPDLIVLSKSIANGLPLSAVGGKYHIMSTFERDDFFVSGTFGGECLSLAACIETIRILEKSASQMIINGTRIKEKFNSLFFNTGAECKGYPTRLTFDFPSIEHKALFMQEMCLQGVLIGYSNMVMADYTEDNMQYILSCLDNTAIQMKLNWDRPIRILQGELPQAALRLR